MGIALFLFLAVSPNIVTLPPATQGQAYSASLGEGLTGCHVQDDTRTSPGMRHGIPTGMRMSAAGTVGGTPTGMVAVYQFAVVCSDRGLIGELEVKER